MHDGGNNCKILPEVDWANLFVKFWRIAITRDTNAGDVRGQMAQHVELGR